MNEPPTKEHWIERARQLLVEAGYNDTSNILAHARDLAADNFPQHTPEFAVLAYLDSLE